MKQLEEEHFVRHMMFGKDQPKWRQYAAFVVGKPTFMSLLSYELRTFFLGPVSGALGLALRRRFYRKLFHRAGRDMVIGRNVTIRHGDRVELGDNVVLDDGCFIDGRGIPPGEVLRIGDNTIIGRNAVIQSKTGSMSIGSNVNIGTDASITSQGGLSIGDWAQIAGGCKISGGRFKLEPDMPDGVPFKRLSTGPVTIGRCTFLGPSVIVTDGASIGDYCAIGPGAVVMTNIPDYAVFLGRPGMMMGSTKAGETAT